MAPLPSGYPANPAPKLPYAHPDANFSDQREEKAVSVHNVHGLWAWSRAARSRGVA